MAFLWRAAAAALTQATATQPEAEPVEFWSDPERAGWLTKQGEYIKTWRRRWFVLKQGRLFWFKETPVTRASRPRGVIPAATCLTVKGAEDVLNRQYAFELSTRGDTMYFIADSEKEKEDWINSIGRSIVQHSRSVTDREIVDYDSGNKGTPPSRWHELARQPCSGTRGARRLGCCRRLYQRRLEDERSTLCDVGSSCTSTWCCTEFQSRRL